MKESIGKMAVMSNEGKGTTVKDSEQWRGTQRYEERKNVCSFSRVG